MKENSDLVGIEEASSKILLKFCMKEFKITKTCSIPIINTIKNTLP
jgi:hypothetical protein